MSNLSHCVVCENQILNPLTGTTCALTDRKPEFHIRCNSIQFDSKFENKLKKIELELFLFSKMKTRHYLTFLMGVIVGLSAIVGGYYMGNVMLEGDYLSSYPLVIILVGILSISLAFTPLFKYQQHLTVLLNNKNDIFTLSKLYAIDYQVRINKVDEVHGIIEYDVDLNYTRKK